MMVPKSLVLLRIKYRIGKAALKLCILMVIASVVVVLAGLWSLLWALSAPVALAITIVSVPLAIALFFGDVKP